MNANVNYGLWMITMCLCGFINGKKKKKKSTTVAEAMDSGGGHVCVV